MISPESPISAKAECQHGSPVDFAAARAELQSEMDRRSAAKVGCGHCEYCVLGAPELCRHYDLSIAWQDIDDAERAAANPDKTAPADGSNATTIGNSGPKEKDQ